MSDPTDDRIDRSTNPANVVTTSGPDLAPPPPPLGTPRADAEAFDRSALEGINRPAVAFIDGGLTAVLYDRPGNNGKLIGVMPVGEFVAHLLAGSGADRIIVQDEDTSVVLDDGSIAPTVRAMDDGRREKLEARRAKLVESIAAQKARLDDINNKLAG